MEWSSFNYSIYPKYSSCQLMIPKKFYEELCSTIIEIIYLVSQSFISFMYMYFYQTCCKFYDQLFSLLNLTVNCMNVHVPTKPSWPLLKVDKICVAFSIVNHLPQRKPCVIFNNSTETCHLFLQHLRDSLLNSGIILPCRWQRSIIKGRPCCDKLAGDLLVTVWQWMVILPNALSTNENIQLMSILLKFDTYQFFPLDVHKMESVLLKYFY